MGSGMVIERGVINTRGRSRDLPVIGGRVEVYHVQAVFEKVDTGDERFALDTVFVEVIWVSIRCCDENYSVRHERFQQSINFLAQLQN
jgi:hypothetical protein